MSMQRLCHENPSLFLAVVTLTAALLWPIAAARSAPPVNDYPTAARVEYVNECIASHSDSLANVYQCSCVIDRIADRLSYDDFIEAVTYSRYSGLPGEGGAIFRDSDQARKLARQYRELEVEAHRACGLQKP